MESVLLPSFPKAPSITAVYPLGSYAYKTPWHKKKILRKEYNFERLQQQGLNQHYKGIEGGSTCQECKGKHIVKAVSGPSFESESQSFGPKSTLDLVKNFFNIFYRFARPYSIISSAIKTTAVSLLAIEKLTDLSPLFFINLLKVTVAVLLGVIYTCGLNQLYDVEIDKINKPNLPLASGEYSYEISVIITASSLILCFWLTWAIGSWPFFWSIFVLLALFSAYSIDLPLLRWKGSGLLTTMVYIVSHAIVIPLGFFIHMQTHVFKKPMVFPRPLIFTIAIMIFYSIALSQLKDIPDVEGDRKHGVRTFSVLFGPKPVFWSCIYLLEIGYAFAILVGATSPFLWSRIIMGLGHIVLASALWYHAKSVDFRKEALTKYSTYAFTWMLMCAEHILILFLR